MIEDPVISPLAEIARVAKYARLNAMTLPPLSDRTRLLILTTLILAVVAMIGVVVAAFDQSVWLAAVKTAAVIIAGGTVLVRVTNPFVRRLEEHVLKLEELTRHLEAKATELAQINRELDDFTYVASHDLKEPLRGISSYCQILREDYAGQLDSEGERRLDALVALCLRLGRLIDDLLAYSRIGRSTPQTQPVDLAEIAQDVMQTFAVAAEQRSATIEISPLPLAQADPMLIAEVYRNLIGNGLKFNESPHPRIELGATESPVPTLYVRDNGIGIAPHHFQEVFTMFRRLHPRRKYDGTGAGLTFVRKIIEAHGGRVWLESELQHGTTVYFTLPTVPANLPSETHDASLCLAH